MTRRTRHAEPVVSHPLWMRWLATFCLALVSVMATAQVAHVHGQWLPKQGVHAHMPSEASQTATSEDHCPLCVAMHSAMPVALQAAPVPAAQHNVVLAESAWRAPESRWTFAMFSRPPPVA